MTEELFQLKQLIDGMMPLSEDDWKSFSSIWEPFTAKRKEILTHAGETEKYLYFVLSGVQRVYYFDEQNREATLVFTYQPSFGGVIDSLLLQQKSRFYYETLTASTFLRTNILPLQNLAKERPAIERFISLGVTNALSGVLTRLVDLQCYSAEERFIHLFNRSPHILQLVPHKYIANYLGIDATNFSKLINKIKI